MFQQIIFPLLLILLLPVWLRLLVRLRLGPANQINLHQINRRGVHCASLFCLEVTYGNTHQS